MDWQPIDTAPRDGRQIILYLADGQFAIAEFYTFSDGSSVWETGHGPGGEKYFLSVVATHWMPLPAPPESQK